MNMKHQKIQWYVSLLQFEGNFIRGQKKNKNTSRRAQLFHILHPCFSRCLNVAANLYATLALLSLDCKVMKGRKNMSPTEFLLPKPKSEFCKRSAASSSSFQSLIP